MTDKERIEELEIQVKKLQEIRAYEDLETQGQVIDGVFFSTEQILALQRIDALQEFNQNAKAVEALEKVKELVNEKSVWSSPFGHQKIHASTVEQIVNQLIKKYGGDE